MDKYINRNQLRLFVGLAAVCLLVIVGCVSKTEFPTDLPDPSESGVGGDTTYLVLQPIWTEANGRECSFPRGVTFGYDGSVYICDTGNDRVVRLSITGEFIEEYAVEHPTQITQDRQLNLICVDGEGTVYRRKYFGGGEFDTALYRDSMAVFIETQRPGVDTVLIDGVWVEINIIIYDTVLTYVPTGLTGIAASPLIDRYYYVVDSTRSQLTVLDAEDHGLAADLMRAFNLQAAVDPIGIMTYPTSETSYNIVLTQLGNGRNDGLRIIESKNGRFRDVRLDVADIYNDVPAGHKQVTADDEGNFLIVSTTGNKVYRFTRHGAFTLSFGEAGSESGQLNAPHGISYGNGTVYIADTGNSRIVRYQLSTGLQF